MHVLDALEAMVMTCVCEGSIFGCADAKSPPSEAELQNKELRLRICPRLRRDQTHDEKFVRHITSSFRWSPSKHRDHAFERKLETEIV